MVNKNNIKIFYQKVTGFAPLDFQIEACEKLLSGKNIIMQAPTGAGKTWASILPFLLAMKEKEYFPQKLIYSLPLRVLANSLYNNIANNEYIIKNGIKVTLQTGEYPNDIYFLDGDITFTTIDQSISSILSIPLSLPKRQANINAGAFVGSYLVFDEFHLLDPERSLSTLFHLLKTLNGISPFCLMTATLSEGLITELATEVNAEIINVNEDDIKNIPSQANKKRTIKIKNKSLEVDDIIINHRPGERTIVICNKVSRCQQIFKGLQSKKESGEITLKKTELICIHSRFFGRDRAEKERTIIGDSINPGLFSKGNKNDAILISTQVIEVGIDITSETMHTEVSTINSIIQRAGRCARFENEEGQIFIYNVDDTRPYNKSIVTDTFSELQSYTEKNLDYVNSQNIIDNVLTTYELEQIKSWKSGNRKEEIRKCLESTEKSKAYELIRDIDTISVVLLDQIDDSRNPYLYETISAHKRTIINKIKNVEIDDWKIRAIKEDNIFNDFETDSVNKYKLKEITPDEALYESIIAVNNKILCYNNDIGLNFEGIGNGVSRIKEAKINSKNDFIITKDTFQEHISYLRLAYNKYFDNRMNFIIDYLNNELGIKIPFNHLIEILFVFHDLGKLNNEWQEKARSFQRRKDTFITNVYLAHTDYDSSIDERIKLPPHAGVGAFVTLFLLPVFFNNYAIQDDLKLQISKIIATAIARHHDPNNYKSIGFELSDSAINLINSSINDTFKMELFIKQELKRYGKAIDLSEFLVDFSEDLEILVYFLFCRILRICDQKSFEFK